MAKFGVLGSGEVGQELAKGLRDIGHEVRIGSRDPKKLAAYTAETKIPNGTFTEVAKWADALVLAVKGSGAADALYQAGLDNLSGKLIIDTTNPITDEPPQDGVLKYFTGPNESLMEPAHALELEDETQLPLRSRYKAGNCFRRCSSLGASLITMYGWVGCRTR